MVDVPDFDSVYRADPDPWRVRSSFYERRKLEIVLAALAAPTYTQAWDPGCGVGELAARLSRRVASVLATDASAEAVALATERCADLPHVEVARSALPARPDRGGFDLVVISEFFYYLLPEVRDESVAMIDSVLAADGELVALHWRPKPHDAFLSGEDVQAEIDTHVRRLGWQPVVQHTDASFQLNSYRRGR